MKKIQNERKNGWRERLESERDRERIIFLTKSPKEK